MQYETLGNSENNWKYFILTWSWKWVFSVSHQLQGRQLFFDMQHLAQQAWTVFWNEAKKEARKQIKMAEQFLTWFKFQS